MLGATAAAGKPRVDHRDDPEGSGVPAPRPSPCRRLDRTTRRAPVTSTKTRPGVYGPIRVERISGHTWYARKCPQPGKKRARLVGIAAAMHRAMAIGVEMSSSPCQTWTGTRIDCSGNPHGRETSARSSANPLRPARNASRFEAMYGSWMRSRTWRSDDSAIAHADTHTSPVRKSLQAPSHEHQVPPWLLRVVAPSE